MDRTQLVSIISDCITVAKKFKTILDNEHDILQKNDLKRIAEMNNEKEFLLQEYAAMKENVCNRLGIPKKRFDRVNIEHYIKKFAGEHSELSALMREFWELQHYCHNQFIINHNVIVARMQFLNKTLQELTDSNQKDELLYTKSGDFKYENPSFGETSV